MTPHRTLDEEIAAALEDSRRSGELRSARDWGRPLDFGDGYDETPVEWRMGFKMLKDAGYAPAEVAMLRELGQWRERLARLDTDSPEAAALRQQIAERALLVQMRIERLRTG